MLWGASILPLAAHAKDASMLQLAVQGMECIDGTACSTSEECINVTTSYTCYGVHQYYHLQYMLWSASMLRLATNVI